jgi:pimeloyl-ACP methyl ester carboxylesterase
MPRHIARWSLAAVWLVVAACGGASPTDSQTAVSGTVAPPASSASGQATAALASPSEPFAIGQVTIDDGRGMAVSCFGTSAPAQPTVLLEHGLDGGSSSWTSVQLALADTVRSCAYDRAGLGGSDPAFGGPRTAADLTDDLESVLLAIGERGPFVVVSHSLGAWVAISFTDRRPDDVVGLVFVDPRPHRVTERHREALPPPDDAEDPVVTEVRSFMIDPAGGFDANVERVTYAASEGQMASVLDVDGPAFGDRPMVVLQAEGTIDDFPPLPPAVRQSWWDIWVEEQSALAAESTAGSVRSVASGHDIPREDPGAVVQAVNDVLAAIAAAP